MPSAGKFVELQLKVGLAVEPINVGLVLNACMALLHISLGLRVELGQRVPGKILPLVE